MLGKKKNVAKFAPKLLNIRGHQHILDIKLELAEDLGGGLRGVEHGVEGADALLELQHRRARASARQPAHF